LGSGGREGCTEGVSILGELEHVVLHIAGEGLAQGATQGLELGGGEGGREDAFEGEEEDGHPHEFLPFGHLEGGREGGREGGKKGGKR
jgi:hypothetical protein